MSNWLLLTTGAAGITVFLVTIKGDAKFPTNINFAKTLVLLWSEQTAIKLVCKICFCWAFF